MVALVKAILVLVETPHIRAYLEANDPKALEQAQAALKGLKVLRPLQEMADLAKMGLHRLGELEMLLEQGSDHKWTLERVQIALTGIEAGLREIAQVSGL